MIKHSIKAALVALGISAFSLSATMFAPGAAWAQPQPPPTPAECQSMTFDKVVVMTAPNYTSSAHDRELVFAPPSGNATVVLLRGYDSCIVAGSGRLTATVYQGSNVLIGGPDRDMLSGGSGSDLIIGNGAPSGQKDVESGGAGEDTCVGDPTQTTKISCEHQYNSESDIPPVTPCSCIAVDNLRDALFGDWGSLVAKTNTSMPSIDPAVAS